MPANQKISSSISTIFRIPTTLKYSPLSPVSEGSTFQIMPDDFSMGLIFLGDSCSSNRGNRWGNVPTGVMALGGSCPDG